MSISPINFKIDLLTYLPPNLTFRFLFYNSIIPNLLPLLKNTREHKPLLFLLKFQVLANGISLQQPSYSYYIDFESVWSKNFSFSTSKICKSFLFIRPSIYTTYHWLHTTPTTASSCFLIST